MGRGLMRLSQEMWPRSLNHDVMSPDEFGL